MRGELVGFAAVISWVAVVQGGVSGCGLHFAVMLVHTHQCCQVASSIAKFGQIGKILTLGFLSVFGDL